MADEVAQRLEFALRQYQSGNAAAARKEYEAILQRQPQCSQAWHLLGLLEFQAGNQQQALDHIGQALSLDPGQAVYLNNYGAVLLSAGAAPEAAACFERAISIRSDYSDAYINLGRAQQSQKQFLAAIESFRTSIRFAPQNLEAYRLLAAQQHDLGRNSEAIEVLRAAIALAPSDATLWNDLGSAYLSDGQMENAIRSLRKAVELSPKTAEIWFNLGSALTQSEDIDAARSALESAVRLRPDRPEWRLREALLCPPVFASAVAVEHYCDSLSVKLQAMAGKLGDADGERLFSAGIHPPLTAAFQGRDNRRLKEELAAVIRPCIQPIASSRLAKKPRVGFVVTRGHAALFERCTGGLIENLDSRGFDLFILCSAACTRFLKERLNRDDLTFVDFPDSYAAAVGAIFAAQCDVLYHWEVGTDSLNYLLPFTQLAPIQCTSWGTQTTSGLREVDYYLSSEWIESSQADQFCTEKLVRLKSLPTYQRRIPKPEPAQRADFGLADKSHLYLCPQNLLKLHADQDELFNAILDRDPAGLIVLKEHRSPMPGEKLRQRLLETMRRNAGRVRFVPWQSSADYYRLLTLADVILDPIHYSAGSSAYDFFSLELPVVSLPGQLNVSRYTQACYRLMGFHDLIASDRSQYVDRAIHVATDAEYREYASGEISKRSDRLFENASAVDDLHEFLTQMIARVRS